jgi:lysophospholipase L1-like esterase
MSRRAGRARAARRLVVALVGTILASFVGPAPAAPADGPARYVALGDSYTAGPGILGQDPDPPGCHRSSRNYPHLVAILAGVAELRDVSCSGARTVDMSSPQPVVGGWNRPQLDAVDADTTLVTLGIGGNDIGFVEIATRCFTLVPAGTPCQRIYARPTGDEISRRMAATAAAVGAVLSAVHERSPLARVLVVGYPAVLPDSGPGCWPTVPVAPGDVAYLRGKEKELNAMLADQAAALGDTFVDVYGPSIGHDACALPTQRWVEPPVPASPAAPVHPNGAGMAGMARVVLDALA